VIDLDALVAGLELGWRNFLGFRLTPPSTCSGATRSRCQRVLREASYGHWVERIVVEGP